MKNKIQPVQEIELIDGFGPTKAKMTTAGVVTPQCALGKHCAHHGSDPYFCCKCGAEFTTVPRHSVHLKQGADGVFRGRTA